jgi:hypothetical protein
MASDSQLPAFLKASLDETKAEYRRLGNSGLRVSVPILGAMSFGTASWLDWVIEEEEVCTVPGSLTVVRYARSRNANC